MRKVFALIAFIILQALSGCSGCKNSSSPTADNSYGLPNETQTGANTMGCLINGKTIILQSSILSKSYPSASLIGDSSLGFAGNYSFSFFQILGFQIKFPKTGSFDLGTVVNTGTYITDSTCLGGSFNVTTATATSGTVTLTKLDKTNHIVSGTFDCKIPISNCDTLNITNGRFDIWLQIK